MVEWPIHMHLDYHILGNVICMVSSNFYTGMSLEYVLYNYTDTERSDFYVQISGDCRGSGELTLTNSGSGYILLHNLYL